MILAGLTRHAAAAPRVLPPHAGWSAAIESLREHLCVEPDLEIARLCEFTAGVAPDEREAAILDLVAEHLGHTWRSGEPRFIEDYVAGLGARYRTLASIRAVPADLIEDEFLVRYSVASSDAPPLTEYARRFRGRTDVMRVLEARCFTERYIRLEKLGRGACGEVFAAFDRHRRALVAIKQARPGAAQPLLAEAALIQRLDHRAIVRVHDVVASGSRGAYYVMPIVAGTTLAARIHDYHFPCVFRSRERTRELWRDLVGAFATVCDAVVHAHARSVLHGDLKPGNVLASDCGETVVLDWGATAATPEYMAPEQVTGRSDERSDVYGLGAILYELLTGHAPRDWAWSGRPPDWRSIVRQVRVPSPARVNPRASMRLAAVCRTALAVDPNARFAAATELATALEAALHPEPGWTTRACHAVADWLRL